MGSSRRPAASCGSYGSGRCSTAGNPPATPWRQENPAPAQATRADGGGECPCTRINQQDNNNNNIADTTAPDDADDESRKNKPPLPANRLPRVVVVEERRDHPDHAASSWSPMTPEPPPDVPRGCCAVYVGAERRRFVVPTPYLGDPVFARLLEKAEEEFGFDYSGGAGITIPCDTEAFKYILVVMDAHRQGLLDDEGNPKEHHREEGEASEITR
ncbi:hypothetical protein EJB05_45845 [Eragrostis curvula]|uniref:Uncharacterized protein n=1 Tax=Eragrostis curvula TaxID=38414 RepID=A0A5J9TLM5_9POAL|nr:hypothetical protein EJB05_45845 [Eragrostis curvula]